MLIVFFFFFSRSFLVSFSFFLVLLLFFPSFPSPLYFDHSLFGGKMDDVSFDIDDVVSAVPSMKWVHLKMSCCKNVHK